MPHRLRALAANTTKVSVVTAKIAAIESIANITSNAATATSGNVSGDAFAEQQIGKTVEQRGHVHLGVSPNRGLLPSFVGFVAGGPPRHFDELLVGLRQARAPVRAEENLARRDLGLYA